jgi:ABC-type amino acid transport substrate-binding protein
MQKARRITAVLLALAMVAAVVALAGCGGTKTATTTTETTKAAPKLVKEGVLTVGSDTAFPPFESMNGSTAEGFDVDLGSALP